MHMVIFVLGFNPYLSSTVRWWLAVAGGRLVSGQFVTGDCGIKGVMYARKLLQLQLTLKLQLQLTSMGSNGKLHLCQLIQVAKLI